MKDRPRVSHQSKRSGGYLTTWYGWGSSDSTIHFVSCRILSISGSSKQQEYPMMPSHRVKSVYPGTCMSRKLEGAWSASYWCDGWFTRRGIVRWLLLALRHKSDTVSVHICPMQWDILWTRGIVLCLWAWLTRKTVLDLSSVIVSSSMVFFLVQCNISRYLTRVNP